MISTLYSLCAFFVFVKSYSYEEQCLNYTLYPVQYDLTITPYLSAKGSYYDCDITITVIANVPGVRVIELDSKDLDIRRESVSVWLQNKNIIDLRRPYELDKKNGKLYLYLREELRQYGVDKNQYNIKISFSKQISNKNHGIFVDNYIESDENRYNLASRTSPNFAKTVFPCFDNPQFETVFKFRLIVPPKHKDVDEPSCLVISQELRRYMTRDNHTVIEYMPSQQIATYQVGVHVSDFKTLSSKTRITNETIVVWTPGSLTHSYTYIWMLGKKLLDIIRNYSGNNKPLTNGPINLVPLYTYISGYEKGSWNLLTNGVHRLAYSVSHTSAKQKEIMSYQLAEQLSRIWLGNPGENIRTRWKEEWFKEGMSTYFAHYYLAQADKTFWDIRTYGYQMRQKAMSVDWSQFTPALTNFDRTIAVFIPAQYDELVRLKTAALLWMIENWLGSEIFHKAMQSYINNRRGKFISVDDFTDYLQKSSTHCEFFKGYTVANVLNSWIAQPGYPVVNLHVYRKPGEDDVIYLEQTHFSFKNSTKKEYSYLIPISYVTQYTKDCYNCYKPKFTISNTGYTFKENLKGGWILLNTIASGYYRVNYDIETWNLVIKTLKSARRTEIEENMRAQLVNDAFALYVSGSIDFRLAMDILDSLSLEQSYVVWEAAMDGFEMLKIDGNIVITRPIYENWKRFMRNKVSNIYNNLENGFQSDHRLRLFKSKIVMFACSLGHTTCLNNLQSKMKRIYMFQSYEPDYREACYYILLNSTEQVMRKSMNNYELEDAQSAENSIKREAKFLFSLSKYDQHTMALKLSSTSPPDKIMSTDTSITVSTPKPSIATAPALSKVTIFGMFCISIIYYGAVINLYYIK